MTMEASVDVHLDRAEECWVSALEGVRAEDLDAESGCPEWTNRELINHLVGGGLRYAKLLAQAPPAEVEATRGMDHLGEDMVGSFWAHERTFRSLAGERDLEVTVPHRIGPIPGRQLVRMRILELALHAADLSRGTGMPWLIDDELAEYIAAELGDLIIDLGATGGYAPPQREDGAARSPAERVLRISGR